MNEDLEKKIVTEKLLNRYKVRIKTILTYHTLMNEMIKKEHQLLINDLLKLIESKIKQ